MSNTHGEWLDRIRGRKRKEKSRLIDTDALEVVTAKVPKGIDAKSYMAGMEYVLGQIDAMPNIEERKTGTWIRTEKHYKDPEQEFYYYEEHCSECGVERKIGWRDASYCPHCGAKMS